MVQGMLWRNFKNYHILRYVIYEFLKKVSGGPDRPRYYSPEDFNGFLLIGMDPFKKQKDKRFFVFL